VSRARDAEYSEYVAARLSPLVFPAQLTRLPRQWRVSSVYYLPDAGVLRASRFALGTGNPDLGADGGLEYQTNLPYFDIDPASRKVTICGCSAPTRRTGPASPPDEQGPSPGCAPCAQAAGWWRRSLSSATTTGSPGRPRRAGNRAAAGLLNSPFVVVGDDQRDRHDATACPTVVIVGRMRPCTRVVRTHFPGLRD
jgi:hypothetical protein